jgi:hypothetical protein
MNYCFHVKGDGSGGGIALFALEGITIDVLSFSKRHIDAHINGGPYDTKWHGTFVYGEPKASDRHLMWDNLRQIKDRSLEPWLMIGDFNEAIWQEEHFSNTRRSERLVQDFRKVLSQCDLYDMGFTGTPWTWDNKQRGERNVKVRLDRAVASPAWSSLFPNLRICHLTSPRSDHCPLLLSPDSCVDGRPTRPIRRYEIMWEREPSLAATVQDAWSRRLPILDLGDINEAMKSMMNDLYSWKADAIGSVPRKLKEKRKELEELSLLSDLDSTEQRNQIAKEMDELLYREEIIWLQRSRIAWL